MCCDKFSLDLANLPVLGFTQIAIYSWAIMNRMCNKFLKIGKSPLLAIYLDLLYLP